MPRLMACANAKRSHRIRGGRDWFTHLYLSSSFGAWILRDLAIFGFSRSADSGQLPKLIDGHALSNSSTRSLLAPPVRESPLEFLDTLHSNPFILGTQLTLIFHNSYLVTAKSHRNLFALYA